MSFSKYEKLGAYHWRALERHPTQWSARLDALYAWFCGEVAARRPSLVVDVGCGDAALTHLLSTRTTGRVVGIEPEPRGIELARKMLARVGSRAEVISGRGEALAFDDASVDVVTMCEVVEHIVPVEPLLEEAARVLRPGGALLISTPQWQHAELRPFHEREFRADELAEVCRPFFAGVEVLVSEPPTLYDRYVKSLPERLAVNAIAIAGANPFCLRRPATPARARWRELHAIAHRA